MNLEKINQMIEDYDSLINLVKSKIEILESLDSQEYYTGHRGIESISFEEGKVHVSCDDTFRGCRDWVSFEFPIEWLLKTQEELKVIVLKEKEQRVQDKMKKQEEARIKAQEEKEQQDFLKYQQLKKKFEKS